MPACRDCAQIWSTRFRASVGFGYRVRFLAGFSFKVSSEGCMVYGLGFRDHGFGRRVYGLGPRVKVLGEGFMVSGLGFRMRG